MEPRDFEPLRRDIERKLDEAKTDEERERVFIDQLSNLEEAVHMSLNMIDGRFREDDPTLPEDIVYELLVSTVMSIMTTLNIRSDSLRQAALRFAGLVTGI